jgi:hypothetical protein
MDAEPRPAVPSDEESEVADFLPPDARLDSAGLTLLDRFLATLDHPTFRAWSPGKQVLYLQLLRHTHGVQREWVEASRMDMSLWTGLAWDTIKKYVPALIEDGLVAMIRPHTGVTPPAYEVFWLPTVSTEPSPPLLSEIPSYIDRLDDDDRKEILRLECLVTAVERRQLQSELKWELRQLGISLTTELVHKLVQWRLLMRSPYRRVLMKKHPDWFAPPEVIG